MHTQHIIYHAPLVEPQVLAQVRDLPRRQQLARQGVHLFVV